MKSRLAWFVTPRGRNFGLGVMCTASCGAFLATFLPHTIYIKKYKEVVSMYQSAEPVPLAERVKERWNEVLRDLSMPKHEIKYLEPFTVFGFDMFRAGTVLSRYGAIVGIPVNFSYESTATIDPTPIQVNNEPVNWNRNDAKELLESLILSEKAQRYGIAREVLMTKKNEPLVRSGLAAFMVSSLYVVSRLTNDRLELLQRPRGVRMIFYTVAAMFTYSIWALQTDLINCYWEGQADSYIAQLGHSYNLGAVEFYEKMQKKNIALRSLLGSQGENVYTPKGNEIHFFRQPSIPIDQRKDFFVKYIAAAKKQSETLDDGEIIAEPA